MTTRRTKRELAHGRRELVQIPVPQAAKMRMVLDHRSTHTPAALDEVFPPAEARADLRKLELHLTPVPGSGLQMAEMELAVVARQCLHRRIPDAQTMTCEVAAWEGCRNRHRAPIDGRFTTKEARMKRKSLYPKELA